MNKIDELLKQLKSKAESDYSKFYDADMRSMALVLVELAKKVGDLEDEISMLRRQVRNLDVRAVFGGGLP